MNERGSALLLAMFLLGLGIGAAAAGRFSARLRFPLRTYAALELVIALFGLFSPLTIRLVPWAIETFGPALPDGAPLALLRLLLSIVVLGPPTVAMGATFPCLVREAERRASPAERAIGLLYGSNTLGAAAGAALGSFLLLPLAGTRGTIVIAAALNLLAGWLAWRLGRGAAPAQSDGLPSAGQTASGGLEHGMAAAGPGARFVLLVAGVSGASVGLRR